MCSSNRTYKYKFKSQSFGEGQRVGAADARTRAATLAWTPQIAACTISDSLRVSNSIGAEVGLS